MPWWLRELVVDVLNIFNNLEFPGDVEIISPKHVVSATKNEIIQKNFTSRVETFEYEMILEIGMQESAAN